MLQLQTTTNERKTKMKVIHTLSFDCDTCYGKGWLFYGGNEDYNVEPCDCNPNSDFDGSLFTNGENE
jgi:hypothetical protein